MKPQLFRATLAFESSLEEEVPDSPHAPKSFGLSDGNLQAHISPCCTSVPGDQHQDQRRITISVAGMSDANGKVLSLNANVYDKEGKWLSAMTASLAEDDVRKLGEAIDAVIELTPEPPREG